MSFTSGTKFGPYEIVAPIGAGGQGQVYKARDPRLNRFVAIKVLPDLLSKDKELRARFEREAHLLASLSHPHVCPVFDVGDENGSGFMVMEFLDGESLADRLEKGPLPVEDALKVAIEMADALEKAHRQGVVHRDVKPSNVMMTKTGSKLIDFGLAKASTMAPLQSQSQAATRMDATAQGTILGTLQYMSPEQLEGHEADPRSDIFAFGAVLYEMVTGRRAFEARSQSSLIAAIMHIDPPKISSLQTVAPAALDHVIGACLAKNPEDRWQTMRDVRRELEWIAAGETSDSPAAVPKPGGFPQKLVRIALIVAATAALTAAAVWSFRSPTTTPVIRAQIALPAGETINYLMTQPLAISPDGSEIVYQVDGKLHLRQLNSFESRVVADTDLALDPFFSPDGQWIGFWANNEMKKVSVRGGVPTTLCTSVGGPNSATWGQDGLITFAPRGGDGIWQVPDSGGAPKQLIPLDSQKDEGGLFWPVAFPQSNAVMFSIKDQLVVQSLRTGERRVLIQGATMATFVEPGYLLYVSGANIMAAPFDPKDLQLTGLPVAVGTGVLHTDKGTALFAASRSGSLVYSPGGLDEISAHLVWVDRAGKVTPIGAPPRAYLQFSLSPNGHRVAVTMGADDANSDIWIADLDSNTQSRFTFNGGLFPIWTPDGKTITYASRGTKSLLNKASDGTQKEEGLLQGDGPFIPDAWSPDGKNLLFHKLEAATSGDLWLLPPEGFAKASPFIKTPAMEEQARFSPDGRWVAYVSTESGRNEVYVQPFPGPGGKWQISTEGGLEPLWSPKGNELFFRIGGKMMSVEVRTAPSFSAGTPRMLFEGRFLGPSIPLGDSAISPDGQRFLMLQPVDPQPGVTELRLVYNVSEELKKLASATGSRHD